MKKYVKLFGDYDIIGEVPMYKKRKLERGYNQSELIAKEIAKNIQNIPSIGSITSPIRNISFISAPPRLSFLNIKLPSFIIKNIIINKTTPDKNNHKAFSNPRNIKLIIIIKKEKIIVTSSGIIKKFISLTNTILNKDETSNIMANLYEKPNK